MLDDFDFRNPDYTAVFRRRVEALKRFREASPEDQRLVRLHYKNNPADFINDFGITFDPRNQEVGRPAVVPFILFPRQREWIEFVVDCWRNRERGLTEKSRDMGVSWLAVALASTMCIFHRDMALGFGSNKAEKVDKIGNPDCLFWKARAFVEYLPPEFNGGHDPKKHAPEMRLSFPETGSSITGEGGLNIGRGGRKGIYFVDEHAHLAHPQAVEASLSQTTNCQQDISTPCGPANPFAEKARRAIPWTPTPPGEERPKGLKKFTYHWRDDPRKDEAWYEKQRLELDPIILAQEVDLDYYASVEGVLIESAWIQSAIDAAKKLKIEEVTGEDWAAFDVADRGKDKNAVAGGKAFELRELDEWSGVGLDLFQSTERAFRFCDENGYRRLRYDAAGVGAGVRGDGRVINARRQAGGVQRIELEEFNGGGELFQPQGEDVKGRKNEDFFENLKAQGWWGVRTKFLKTHRAIHHGGAWTPEDIISISPKLKLLSRLTVELAQPTYSFSLATGKMVVDKTPDDMKSPNLADSVMMRFARVKRRMKISDEALKAASR